MKQRIPLVFTIAALVLAASAPISAQTWHLTANVPFQFTVAGKVLPAGAYGIKNGTDGTVVAIQGLDTGAAAVVLTYRSADSNRDRGVATLTFNRYGDTYFLSEVWNGFTASGRAVPSGRTERELSRTASAQKFEVLATLARR